MRSLKLIILVALAASFGSAQDEGCPDIHISLVKALRLGLHLSAAVIITNTSKHKVEYYDRNSVCDYSITVLNTSGKAVAETDIRKQLACGSGGLLVELAPGGSTTDSLDVNSLYVMSSPGDYTVQVQRDFTGMCRAKSNIATIRLGGAE